MSDSHEAIRKAKRLYNADHATFFDAMSVSDVLELLADRDRLAAALQASPVAPASEGEDAARTDGGRHAD